MSKHSPQQFARTTLAGIGLSVTSLYVLYNMNARKQRFKGQIRDVKDDFNRIKEESSERFKVVREDFKCMPAVQEAQRLAKAQKFKWNEGKEQLKEYKRILKEALKSDSSHQDGSTPALEFIKSREKDLQARKIALEDLFADERFKEIWIVMDGAGFSLTDLECLRDSMDCVLEVLRTDEKRLGWSLEIAAAWNDYANKRETIAHVLKDLK